MRQTRSDGDKRGDRDGRRRPVRLGSGDYTVEGVNSAAQWLYLQAVERCVPEAMSSLAAVTNDSEFREWAKIWGFLDAWALRQAKRTVEFWRKHPEYSGEWGGFAAAFWEPDFPGGPSWNPLLETEMVFRQRVDDYIEAVKKTPGITLTPKKTTGKDHFEWLALHHVGGCTYEEISQKYGDADGSPDVPAVSRAVTETAEIAGVSLRPARGRKLSQKS